MKQSNIEIQRKTHGCFVLRTSPPWRWLQHLYPDWKKRVLSHCSLVRLIRRACLSHRHKKKSVGIKNLDFLFLLSFDGQSHMALGPKSGVKRFLEWDYGAML
jgi:hypothetical protein